MICFAAGPLGVLVAPRPPGSAADSPTYSTSYSSLSVSSSPAQASAEAPKRQPQPRAWRRDSSRPSPDASVVFQLLLVSVSFHGPGQVAPRLALGGFLPSLARRRARLARIDSPFSMGTFLIDPPFTMGTSTAENWIQFRITAQ